MLHLQLTLTLLPLTLGLMQQVTQGGSILVRTTQTTTGMVVVLVQESSDLMMPFLGSLLPYIVILAWELGSHDHVTYYFPHRSHVLGHWDC